jgi:hypothetical protein
MVLFLIPPVFAKNISPTHRFGGYFFVNAGGIRGGASLVITIFGLGLKYKFYNY